MGVKSIIKSLGVGKISLYLKGMDGCIIVYVLNFDNLDSAVLRFSTQFLKLE